MASPQKEHGYTAIANEIVEAIYSTPFNGSQLRIVLWVFRNSYGWRRKKTDATSIRQIGRDLLMSHGSMVKAANQLAKADVLVMDAAGKWSVNKDHDAWDLDRITGHNKNQAGQNIDHQLDLVTPATTPPGWSQPRPKLVAPLTGIKEKESKESLSVKRNRRGGGRRSDQSIKKIFDHWNSKGIVKHREVEKHGRAAPCRCASPWGAP